MQSMTEGLNLPGLNEALAQISGGESRRTGAEAAVGRSELEVDRRLSTSQRRGPAVSRPASVGRPVTTARARMIRCGRGSDLGSMRMPESSCGFLWMRDVACHAAEYLAERVYDHGATNGIGCELDRSARQTAGNWQKVGGASGVPLVARQPGRKRWPCPTRFATCARTSATAAAASIWRRPSNVRSAPTRSGTRRCCVWSSSRAT